MLIDYDANVALGVLEAWKTSLPHPALFLSHTRTSTRNQHKTESASTYGAEIHPHESSRCFCESLPELLPMARGSEIGFAVPACSALIRLSSLQVQHGASKRNVQARSLKLHVISIDPRWFARRSTERSH